MSCSNGPLPRSKSVQWIAIFGSVCTIVLGASIDLRAEELSPKLEAPELEEVGHPLSEGMVELLKNEIVEGMTNRGITPKFDRFRRYAGAKLNATRADRTGSEVTGLCRLSWYEKLLRDPLNAPAEADRFTRELHMALRGDHTGLDHALVMAREKMDLRPAAAQTLTEVNSPEEALAEVEQRLVTAQVAYGNSLATLSQSEVNYLVKYLYTVFGAQGRNGHTLPSRSTGQKLCKLLRQADRAEFHAAVESLIPLSSPAFLSQLGEISDQVGSAMQGVTGTLNQAIATSAGHIIIGGRGANTYQLDGMGDVCAVIDLGGNDTYYEGKVSPGRPVLVIIDLSGDDVYRGTKPGVQAGAVLGISVLLDVEGNDVYQAKDVAQGSCIGGAGILVDYAGNDQYIGVRRAQGQALGGIGILVDRDGNDRYHAAMWAQGFGNPLGFAVLEDSDGDDTYFCGGLYYDSYEETPGYDGWGQGVGAGIRQVANGGIGTLLDGGGDDTYEFDYMAHGGGYWLGVGFARDFGGNDQRLGATRRLYSGGTRREKLFQRFSNGFGCHYALGFCFDDEGDDTYKGTIMGLGMGWDMSAGFLFDFGGNDRYEATGGYTQGTGAEASLGAIYDYEGDDTYLGYGQGRALSGISYHDLPYCGGNFSFVVDHGGEDAYGCRAKNNSYNKRTSSGGFLIDRPKQEEIEQAKKADDTVVGS